MLQFQLLIPIFALRVEVDAAYASCNLVEADIIEPFEASSRDLSNPVIRNEKVFLPPHKYVLSLRPVLIVKIGFFGLRLDRAVGWESAPVVVVSFLVCTPILVLRLECVFRSDEFAFEIGSENMMLIGEALDS